MSCLSLKEWVSQESKVNHHSRWTCLWCRLLSSGTQFTLDTYGKVLSALCLNYFSFVPGTLISLISTLKASVCYQYPPADVKYYCYILLRQHGNLYLGKCLPPVTSEKYWFVISVWKIQNMLVPCRISLCCAAACQEGYFSFFCRSSA